MNHSNEADSGEQTKSWLERTLQAFSQNPSSITDVKDLLRKAVERNVLSLQVLPLLEGSLIVSEMQVREIMIPVAQMTSIPTQADTQSMLEKVIESGHSRLPVTDESGSIRGILHAKDALPLALTPENGHRFVISEHMRKPILVPESTRLSNLLQFFRKTRNHMAVVIDEYANVTGIVTIEDVLEQIVGDIADEHDIDDEDSIKQIDPGVYTVKAITPLADFNACLKTDFSSDDYETIGGMVLHAFGRMPNRDESVSLENLQFTVLNADSRRLHLLQVSEVKTAVEADGESV